MKIKVINVTTTTKPTAKGSYTMLEVAYTNIDSGKIEGKKIMSFSNKEVFGVLSKAASGSMYDIVTKKNEQTGYWDWVEANTTGNDVAQPVDSPKSFTSPKSTYETPEERAKKQVYIIRQSSLSNAIDTLKTDKNSPKLDEVLALAESYYNWVVEKEPAIKMPSIEDMDDDIPL